MENELTQRIKELKKQRNAVILAHNYQNAEVQDLADVRGDSLELSRKAAETNADVIVFCGVHFMAETAAVLSPDKTVLLPDLEAGCPMADMITAEQLRELKAGHPNAATIGYVNTSAAVKAECDCCCTSANAVDVVNAYRDAEEIIFVPDQYLGEYAARLSGRKLILWPGYCPTHARILPAHIAAARAAHPGAPVMAHPECTKPIKDLADAVLSTGGMCRYVRENPAQAFIVATENGMLHRLRREAPEKQFFAAAPTAVCPNMKKIRVEKILWALEDMTCRVVVPEPVRSRAAAAISRMLEV